MNRKTYLSLSLSIGLFLLSSVIDEAAAQSRDATRMANRPGLFRRFNITQPQHQHHHSHSSSNRQTTPGRDPDPISIPKPIQFDELQAKPITPSRPHVSKLLTDDSADAPLVDPQTIDEPVEEGTDTEQTIDDVFGDVFEVNEPDEIDVDSSSEDVDSSSESADQQESTPVTPQPAELSADMIELRGEIRRNLAYYFIKKESASGRSPWGIMHTLISYGVDTEIYASGRKVNAIGWLCWNGSCRGQRLFYTRNGKIGVNQGPGVEGHKGQFLAMLAQSRVKSDFPLRINGREFTVDDLIEHEKLTCRPRSELTFKLIGLSHYLDADTTWKNDRGHEWSISRLIKEELAQRVVGAACGGTHRMMGFAYAVRRRELQGKEITGQWKRAQKYVKDFQDYTFRLQNPDGSFSTNWFEGRGNHNSNAEKVKTTGHILEWMVYSLPEDQLQDERLLKAVHFLNNTMWKNRNFKWEVGPRGHALHALVLYDQLVFGAKPGQGGPKIASNELSADTE